MIFPSTLIEQAITAFSTLPGIGKKTALRHILHLLKKDKQQAMQLVTALENLLNNITFCTQCFNVSDAQLCNICSNTSRKKEVICVVENINHLIAIESTQQFNGTYHVLDGLISPLDGIGPEQLHIDALVARVKEHQVTEIIIALNANMDGDTTAYYLHKVLTPFNITITSIAKGVAFGGELEYTDEMTLARSLQHRLPVASTNTLW